MKRLIVTNGDHTVEHLRDAGIGGDILPWRDVLHDGPVRRMEDLEHLSRKRARYIAREFGLDETEVGRQFTERDALLRSHGAYDRIELWFEHDLYDQLQLLQLLDFFANEGHGDGLYLVQAVDYLTDHAAEDVQRLAGTATPVTATQSALAQRAWQAFTSAMPIDLVRLCETDCDLLPHLKVALARLLQEYPDPVRGLSLTEERLLRRLADGPGTPSTLFRDVSEMEDARFLGDASFFRRLDRLAFATRPLIEGLDGPFSLGSADNSAYADSSLTLTATGKAVLAGHSDHALENGPDWWIGGVHLQPAVWMRYDRKHETLIAPR